MAETFSVVVGGDRRKTPDTVKVRNMTKAEILALGYGDHPNILGNDGSLRTVKINGQVRTWKRDADRIEVPVKYGLYEYATFDLAESLRRFVVVVG